MQQAVLNEVLYNSVSYSKTFSIFMNVLNILNKLFSAYYRWWFADRRARPELVVAVHSNSCAYFKVLAI